jgi:hypothetical protein
MIILFIDDSYRSKDKYLGYGGFCVDEKYIRDLNQEVSQLKKSFKIPLSVELKWSPPPGHYLRKSFKGKRSDLYNAALDILETYDTKVICAVHAIKECYGYALHGWSLNRTALWAAKQQYMFIAERFEKPYLHHIDDYGLIISDKYESKDGEDSLIKDFSLNMVFGTEFCKFERIVLPPLMTISKYSAHIQLADIVIGIVISSLANSRYGIELFEKVSKLFMRNIREGSVEFISTFSSSILGYGLKVFPVSLNKRVYELFSELDKKYLVTREGLKRRESN